MTNKPKTPLIRIIREDTLGDCPECGSTTLRKYRFLLFSLGPKIGCIQPECSNYCKRISGGKPE